MDLSHLSISKYISFFIGALLFASLVSCEKEDSLKDLELPPNEFENSTLEFITVENVRQGNCDKVFVDIVVHFELFPDTISNNLSGYVPKIIDPFGKEFFAKRYKGQDISTICRKECTFQISFYHYKTKKETKPFTFTYTTK